MTDTGQIQKLKQLIDSSDRILVTSHISPDPDAISSVILLSLTLKTNFPDKATKAVLEEAPIGLEAVPGYDDVLFGNLYKEIDQLQPQLIIILDANNVDRITRQNAMKVRDLINQIEVKLAIIDHHEPVTVEKAEAYINQGSPATVQDVYEICFETLGLKKPKDFAQLTMLGLYSDSGGFAYKNNRHTETFKLANDLVASGADIEKINNLINQYTETDMQVFAELAKNLSHHSDYSYSYISDKFADEWVGTAKTGAQLHKGTEAFVNDFIRNIEGRKWGFITYKNLLQGDGVYSASFRSVAGTKDVSVIASRLGGGGHKGAAGAKFEAKSLEEAVSRVKQAIGNS